jgi:hypothetical protein
MDICNNPNPCLNQGACFVSVSNRIQNYECKCVPGTTGKNCETDINECESAPCRNMGVCSTPQLNMYKCNCSAQYTGQNCENFISLDPCIKPMNPCQNGAICMTNNQNSYSCVCKLGFSGELCQYPMESNQTYQKQIPEQNINVFGLSSHVDFSKYKECIRTTWNSLNMHIPLSNIDAKFDSSRSALRFTGNLFA